MIEREKQSRSPEFEINDRGFSVTAWYLLDTTESAGAALIEISKDSVLVRRFEMPSYKIWNIAAHFGDIVDSEIAKDTEGYELATSDGLGGHVGLRSLQGTLDPPSEGKQVYFYADEGQRRKAAGIAQVSEGPGAVWLADARRVALCYANLSEEVTIDDVLRHVGLPPAGLHHNLIGAVFAGKGCWERVGMVPTKRPEGHGRLISVWKRRV